MEILYRRGRASAKEVWSDLPDDAGYSGIRKLLEILVAKGTVVRVREGRHYVYRPKLATEMASRLELKRVVKSFFRGNVESAMVALMSLSTKAPDEADLERILSRARSSERGRSQP